MVVPGSVFRDRQGTYQFEWLEDGAGDREDPFDEASRDEFGHVARVSRLRLLRDESMHCNFGIDLINQIKLENPQLWTSAFKDEIKSIFEKAVELEYRYAEDTMPRGVLGLNAPMFKGYLRYICNRRCLQIGLDAMFPNEENPFPWMSEMIDLKKERNFFETRVIEYQTGGALSWE